MREGCIRTEEHQYVHSAETPSHLFFYYQTQNTKTVTVLIAKLLLYTDRTVLMQRIKAWGLPVTVLLPVIDESS